MLPAISALPSSTILFVASCLAERFGALKLSAVKRAPLCCASGKTWRCWRTALLLLYLWKQCMGLPLGGLAFLATCGAGAGRRVRNGRTARERGWRSEAGRGGDGMVLLRPGKAWLGCGAYLPVRGVAAGAAAPYRASAAPASLRSPLPLPALRFRRFRLAFAPLLRAFSLSFSALCSAVW